MDNFYAAEDLIIARVEARLAAANLRKVYSEANLEGITLKTVAAPSVTVVFNGFDIGDQASEDGQVLLHQRWLVTAIAKNVRKILTGKAARDEAGEILQRLLGCLPGWRPSVEHGPLRLLRPPPRRYEQGKAFAPLLFSTAVAITGDPT